MRPRNCLTSFGVLGGSMVWILSTFQVMVLYLLPIQCVPSIEYASFKKLHLTSLSFKSALLNLSNRSLKCPKWDSISGLKTNISSK